MLDRRHFLSTAATGIAASITIRGNLLAQLERTPPLPDHSLSTRMKTPTGPRCGSNS